LVLNTTKRFLKGEFFMEVKFNLKKVLMDHNLYRPKVTFGQMEAATGVERHIISAICRNERAIITLKQLSRICAWLDTKDIPSEELLGHFFSTGRAHLWQALAKKGTVTIYLGEHYQKDNAPLGRNISRRDSEVVATIVRRLSMRGMEGSSSQGAQITRPPQIRIQYVPFCYVSESSGVVGGTLPQDIKRTKKIYQRLKDGSKENASIIIGSQRTNFLLEHFVAGLFKCKPFPFMEVQEGHSIPFFSVYRENDRKIPSCFGGNENPFRTTKTAGDHGLHYLDKGDKWISCKWDEYETKAGKIIIDAGIIIIVKDNKTKAIEIAVFGFSGRATEAIGQKLVVRTEDFWPPYMKVKGKEVGIHVCKLKILEPKDKSIDGTIETLECKVVRLSERILKKYLK
jgi:DNA-binding Xre family transcriptional regulator